MDIILRQQPFQRVIGRVREVVSLQSERAVSGRTFKVTDRNGKLYKLHSADSLKTALLIERNVSLAPHVFPQFYGREGRFLLFDWIEGRTLTKEESPDVYEKIGRLCADVHNLNDVQEKDLAEEFFSRLAKISTDIFTDQEKSFIADTFRNLNQKLRVDIVLGINDIHRVNFMVDFQDNVYFVDEGGLLHQAKGLGQARAFLSWFTAEARHAFEQGYKEKHSLDYFDKDYEKFMTLMECLRAIFYRSTHNVPKEKFATEVEWIRAQCGLNSVFYRMRRWWNA